MNTEFKFFIIVVLCGGSLEYLQRFLKCIKFIILEFTPSAALFDPLLPSPDSGAVSTGISFAFTCMSIYYLHHLLLSNFVEEKNIKDNKKNMAFLLV
jgi:hypothetical protein